MKTTGIIRRIDELGRVVIPKEIRRTCNIHEGDPLEIYIDNDAVCFKKYFVVGEFLETINHMINDVGDEYEMKNRQEVISKLNEVVVLLKAEE